MRRVAAAMLVGAAILNLGASFGYFANSVIEAGVARSSALAAGLGESAPAADEPRVADAVSERVSEFKSISGRVRGTRLVLGVYLAVSVVVLLLAALYVLEGAHARFLVGAAAIALGAELMGGYVTHFGIGNLVGFLAALVVVLAVIQMKRMPRVSTAKAALSGPDSPTTGRGTHGKVDIGQHPRSAERVRPARGSYDGVDKMLIGALALGGVGVISAILWAVLK